MLGKGYRQGNGGDRGLYLVHARAGCAGEGRLTVRAAVRDIVASCV